MRSSFTTLLGLPLLALLVLAPAEALAVRAGLSGFSGKQGGTCSGCHNGGGAPNVQITGPANLAGGATGDYTLTVGGGAFGFNIAVSDGSTLIAGNNAQIEFGELTHNRAVVNAGTAIRFRMTAPATGGAIRIFAAGLQVNNNGGPSGDGVATTTFNVTAGVAAGAPTVTGVTTPNAEIRAATTTVAATAVDDGGEAALRYTWSVDQGPGAATFAPNGNNAAKASTATFTAAGNYKLKVTVADAGGAQATGTVDVKVTAAPTSVAVAPTTVGVPTNGTQQFTAVLLDQFRTAVSPQPTFTWNLPLGGGRVSNTGLFTAGNAAQASLPLSAAVTVGGVQRAASATITVASGTAPTVTTQPAAVIQGTSANLSVDANDDGGAAALTYEWSFVSGPGDVTFTPNSSNAAKNTVAKFSAQGAYQVSVLIKDGTGLTAAAVLNVNSAGGDGLVEGPNPGNPTPPLSTDWTWRKPRTGQSFAGEFEVELLSAASTGNETIAIAVDGIPAAEISTAPFRAWIQSCDHADGEHVLSATVTDAAGASVSVQEVSVRFANAGANSCPIPTPEPGAGGCAAAGGAMPLTGIVSLALAALALRRRRSAQR